MAELICPTCQKPKPLPLGNLRYYCMQCQTYFTVSPKGIVLQVETAPQVEPPPLDVNNMPWYYGVGITLAVAAVITIFCYFFIFK